jgi:phytoene desaturase
VAEREVLVVGAGVGGLAAALALAARGLAVRVLEAGPRPGGKAGTVELDGIRVETGPSVLTLPGVFADVFARAGLRLADVIELRRLDPGFRYRYSDGCVLDVAHEAEQTLANVRSTLGPAPAGELAGFLAYSRRIWEAAAPHFVLGPAPTWTAMAGMALRHPRALAAVDPLRSMAAGIDRQVRDPHLRMLLRRYATYNGSDPRHAPATLNCIAHVELSLGGYGIEGGVFALIEALVSAIETRGGVIECGAKVDRVLLDGGVAVGVVLAGGGCDMVGLWSSTPMWNGCVPVSTRRPPDSCLAHRRRRCRPGTGCCGRPAGPTGYPTRCCFRRTTTRSSPISSTGTAPRPRPPSTCVPSSVATACPAGRTPSRCS